jgi:3-oxoacyl-[acyl-carrier protein] reductase
MDLKGKVALITGAGQGIGKGISKAIYEAGADIVVADIDISLAIETAKEISLSLNKSMGVRMDVSNSLEVREVTDRILAEWGRIDILVNNAGITRDGLLIRMKDEDWDRVLDVNLNGTFNCVKTVLPRMLRQKYGRIVNIASIVGLMGNIGQANYAASKAAIIGFSKSVAREYASKGINVNVVAPGFIDTAMTQQLSEEARTDLLSRIPQARLGTPMDIAFAVRFLVSDEASYITGQVINVNGGMLMV